MVIQGNQFRCAAGIAFLLFSVFSNLGCWKEIPYEPTNSSTPDEQKEEIEPTNPEIPVKVPRIEATESKQPPEKGLPAEDGQHPQKDSEQLTESTEDPTKKATQPAEKTTSENSNLKEQDVQDLLLDDLFPDEQKLSSTPPDISPSQVTKEPRAEMPTDKAQSSPKFDSKHIPQAAWQLGSSWSLGAAFYAKNQPEKRYEQTLTTALASAQQLKIELSPLPKTDAGEDRVRAILTYLLVDQGPKVAKEVERLYGQRQEALLMLAIRSHALLLVYSPRNLAKNKGWFNKERFQEWQDQLEQLAIESQLPENLWRPLHRALGNQASYPEVKDAIFELHKRVPEELE